MTVLGSYNGPCAHAPGTGRLHERIFFLCGGVHNVSTAEPFLENLLSEKQVHTVLASNRYEKFVNAYFACNPGLPLVEAKRKADDAWRETGSGMEKTRKK